MNRGVAAEALAERFLVEQGLTIVQRNYRCRGGEIDLVAHDGATLVFVEVRLRGNRDFGTAAESITAAKLRRLRFAARHYLSRLGHEPPCRFDAVLLDSLPAQKLEWLRNVDCP